MGRGDSKVTDRFGDGSYWGRWGLRGLYRTHDGVRNSTGHESRVEINDQEVTVKAFIPVLYCISTLVEVTRAHLSINKYFYF